MIESNWTVVTVTLVASDDWLEYTVRYVVKYTNLRHMKSQLFNRILDEIGQTNGQVAIASTTIHIVETPKFDVHIRRRLGVSDS